MSLCRYVAAVLLLDAAAFCVMDGGSSQLRWMASVQQESVQICSPDAKEEALRCDCATRDADWCQDDSPPPYCCKFGDKKATRCGCCKPGTRVAAIGKMCRHA